MRAFSRFVRFCAFDDFASLYSLGRYLFILTVCNFTLFGVLLGEFFAFWGTKREVINYCRKRKKRKIETLYITYKYRVSG